MTTMDKTSKGKGLGFKIILLGVIPVILMAILNITVSLKTSSLFNNTLTSLNHTADTTSTALLRIADLNNKLLNVRKGFSDLSNFHQKTILQRNTNAVAKTRDLRVKTSDIFPELMKSISSLDETMLSANMIYASEEVSQLQIWRLNTLKRMTTNLPRMYEIYASSNERSAAHLESGREDKAANNFIFEESFYQDVLQKSLDHCADVLDALTFEVTNATKTQRESFNVNVENQLSKTEVYNYLILAFVGILILVVASVFATRKISKPLVNMVDAMGSISQGNLDVEIPQNQTDEIGEMANALTVFKNSIIENKRAQEERAQERERQAQVQKEQRLKLANDFESTVGQVVSSVAASSGQLQNTAKDMSQIANDTQGRASNATNAAMNATTNVQTVASAAEELSHSINEISRQVADSSTMASTAADKAQTTNHTMRELAVSASKIGEVIDLITNIAEQTNLLALNATIEAARAGDAGKGFAVVASEVKNLANQTSSATEEIANQISEIQDKTRNAVSAIEEVSKMIDHMNEVSAAIAAAVEEQGAATAEIASNVEQAALSTQDASTNMDEVTSSAEQNGRVATDVLHAAEGLSSQASSLRQQVDLFLNEIRQD